jgi:hypothetical protein
VRTRSFHAAVALTIACARAGGGDEGDGGTDSDGAEPRPIPDFVEPASDEMLLGVERHDDLVLPVASVLPGITTLVVDGVDAGPLTAPGGIGLLAADRLELRLEGAMVPSVHEMLLRTPDVGEPLHSRTIRVVLAQEPAPALVLELDDALPGAPATAIAAAPLPDDALLLAVDHDAVPDPVLRVARLVEGAWSLAGARTVAAPGLRRAAVERAPAISAFLAGERLRVAWRVGFPGERIDFVEVDGSGDDAGAPVAALTLSPALTGPVEWAAFGRPLVLGDRLLAELQRHADVEAPVPGGLALATAVIDGAQIGLSQIVQLGDTADLDAIAPAVDLLASSRGDAVVSLRLGRNRPVLIDVALSDAAVRLRPSVVAEDPPGFAELTTPVATIAGAFASRTVAAFDGERLRVLRWDDSGMSGLADVSPPADALPPASAVTGEIAGTVVGGAPVFVLPFGADLPLVAVVVTEPSATVQTLADDGCDAVAASATAAGNDGGAAAIACLRQGTVRLGRLRVAP